MAGRGVWDLGRMGQVYGGGKSIRESWEGGGAEEYGFFEEGEEGDVVG